jgi:bcr-type benzoyl-CoA reductase subunit C
MNEINTNKTNTIEALLRPFEEAANDPRAQLEAILSKGKKAIGVFPYYIPEEIPYAAGLVPFGIWGGNVQIREAGRYFAAFYCDIARSGLEYALNGTLDKLCGVIMPSLCDTLRPLTQNFRAARPDIPFFFLAQPQNRRADFGVEYTKSEYIHLKEGIERLTGAPIVEDALRNAIEVYNRSRETRRNFVRLAGKNPALISPKARLAVLKSAYFMDATEYTDALKNLNEAIEVAEKSSGGKQNGDYIRIVTSGIIADNPGLLRVFEENGVCIAADDIAHESRAIRYDVPPIPANGDAITALAMQFAERTDDSLLYEPDLSSRDRHLVKLVRENDAKGVLFLMMQFCDPEELDYPHLKATLDREGIPSLSIPFDQQMREFGQAKTQIEAFCEVLRA